MNEAPIIRQYINVNYFRAAYM